MALLDIQNITVRFDGVAALDAVTLSIEAGTITSLIGPNGSGKTTLTNVLTGLVPPSAGTIHIKGFSSVKRLKPYQASDSHITRTFQEVRIFHQMSVIDNVMLALSARQPIRGLFTQDSSAVLKTARELLSRVGLSHKTQAMAGELSYGQRKMLEVARALSTEAHLYLFDEPFAGLYKETLEMIVTILQALKASGKTVLLIEHNMDLIRRLSDRVIVLDSGKVLADGTPDHVLSDQRVIEAYLGE